MLKIVYTDDINSIEKLEIDTLYVKKSGDYPKWAYLLCPCGCKEPIMITVSDIEDRNWRLKINNEVPTITPSILRMQRCKSHFFITDGEVVWC